MAGNVVNLEFAGDATKLTQAGKKAESATDDVGTSATRAGDDMKKAGDDAAGFTSRLGSLGAGVTGMSDAVEGAAGTLQAFVDIQNAGYERSQKLKRALVDVQQAQEDYNQALRDAKQAAIDSDQAEVDLEQAHLDARKALVDYNTAVKEHGKNSIEAKQAQLDLKQAGVDVQQAQEDAAQATRDGAQAAIDAQSATLDLADAQREAAPTDLQKYADQLNTITPLLTAVVGVVGLVTAAQWLWNAAQAANPIGLIITLVAALVAVIVVIATKTDWFQKAWKWAWGGIKDAAAAVGRWFKDTLWGSWIKGAWDAIKNKAESVWNWMKALPGKLKSAFAAVAQFLFQPFRTAFNLVSAAWNNTIGRLHWTIPGWVPGIGGNSISAPRLPRFHEGTRSVPGPRGADVLALLQGGEEVRSNASQVGAGGRIEIGSDGSRLGDLLVELIAATVERKGGRPEQLGLSRSRLRSAVA